MSNNPVIDLKELRSKYESMFPKVEFSNFEYSESINAYKFGVHTKKHEYVMNWLAEINFGWRVFQMCNGVPDNIVAPLKTGLKVVFDDNGKANFVKELAYA